MYHDFHLFLVATKLLTAKLHLPHAKASEILERSELQSEILLPIPQPCVQQTLYTFCMRSFTTTVDQIIAV